MELRNKLSLEIEEAILILQNLAASLAEKGKFELQLENQEVSLDVGHTLSAILTFSNTRFSLDFQWAETEAKSTPPLPKSTPQPVAVKTPTMSNSEVIAQITTLRAQGLKPRKFKKQMILETTTLPYDGGVWSPAFTLSERPIWTPVDINNQLENAKWISEEELEALSGDDLPRKPRAKTPGVSRDDDMFSTLDQDEKKQVPTRESKPSPRTMEREVVRPAGMVSSTIPKVTLKKAELDRAAATWHEPTAEENVSGDDWVKPSDVLSKKKAQPTSRGIPSPGKAQSSEVETTIRTWHEPNSEDNSSADSWVKPSEILKQKNENVEEAIEKNAQNQDVIKKKNRPPPTAPDEEEEKKKKGWAKW